MPQRARNPAGGVFGIPWLDPGPDAFFKVGHDLAGDARINVLTFCFLHRSCFHFKGFFFPKSLGMEAGFRSRADLSQGGGAAGVHRQTLDGGARLREKAAMRSVG